jgi:hypothetical protein
VAACRANGTLTSWADETRVYFVQPV